MNLLHTLGLMKRSEHEAAALQAEADKQLLEKLTAERDQAITAMAHAEFSRDCWRDLASDHEAKFKRAATDLAAQAEEIKALKIRLHYAEPRAKKWDDSLKRSRDRKEAKKHVAKPLVAAEPPNRDADRKRMAGKRGKA